jgi:CrcB protein
MGGAIGTWGRYEVEKSWPTTTGHFPMATFVINTTGAFLIGLLLTVVLKRMADTSGAKHLRHFAGVGLLGGWTTMSTLAVETDTLLKGSYVLVAIGYMATTLLAGYLAVWLGTWLGSPRPRRRSTSAEATWPEGVG